MFLDADDREELKKRFEENLANKVKLIHFTRELDCQYCRETKQLLTELAELSDKIVRFKSGQAKFDSKCMCYYL